jgi:hypothetical protein
MIVSFNFYYARPGLEDAVLKQRLRASDVREGLGIPRGRVIARTEGAPTLPDVIWEQHFEAVAGHHEDMAVRAASPEFEAVRAGMRKLCRRFERPLFEVERDDPAQAASTALVALGRIFCPPEKTKSALDVLDRHIGKGLDRGRVLRLVTPGEDLPALVWQREYAGRAAAASQDLGDLRAALAPHADRVEASVWKVE